MARKSDPFEPWPDWSRSKFFSFLRSGLRAKWSRWPPKYEALKLARRPYKGPNTRQKHEFLCADCGNWFAQKDVSVDHITPAGTLKAFSDLPDFCERLFVGTDKLQVLCTECHKRKTKQEASDAKNKEKQNADTPVVSNPKASRPSRPNQRKPSKRRK